MKSKKKGSGNTPLPPTIQRWSSFIEEVTQKNTPCFKNHTEGIMLPDLSSIAHSSVCRLKRGGGISPLLIQKGDIRATFCSLVDNINLFFQTCSWFQCFSGCDTETPQARKKKKMLRKTFSVLCNSESRAMWKTLKVKKQRGEEDGLLEQPVWF